MKAVAEFVENSIDAHAQHVTIIRGRSRGQPYLKIVDDGDGVPLGDDDKPNFKYVATHICDSIKRQMKAQGQRGIRLRYICRLFAKELVIRNFPGYAADELVERMIELLLYTEENLR